MMTASGERFEVLPDLETLSHHVAKWMVEEAAKTNGVFSVALSGGATPRRLYSLLADEPYRGKFPWLRAHWFWGDERFVPPGDAQSNYRMARETLLAHVNPRGVFPIPTDDTPQSAADRYEETLRQQYGSSVLEPDAPLFHLTLLGLGDDGHTASLLPDQPVLHERRRWVAVVPHGRQNQRITLTYPALEASALILFLIAGAAKRDALAQARGGALPAGALKPRGQVLWLADAAAAGEENQGYGF